MGPAKLVERLKTQRDIGLGREGCRVVSREQHGRVECPITDQRGVPFEKSAAQQRLDERRLAHLDPTWCRTISMICRVLTSHLLLAMSRRCRTLTRSPTRPGDALGSLA